MRSSIRPLKNIKDIRMKLFPFIFLLCFFTIQLNAQKVSGVITDANGKALPYASVTVKGSAKGTSANNEGKYFIEVNSGKYTLVVQYVGYQKAEQTITVQHENVTLNFQLQQEQLSLKNVTVKAGGEDPAYEIIRHAIKKRKDYESPLDSFTCEAYIKTLIKSRKVPKRIFGQKIDSTDRKEMGVDSAGKGIMFLSESLTKIAYKKPDKIKLEVLSGRESGSNGYGFNFPAFINFYKNNVNALVTEFAPRGYVSPIAENALNFYKYHYLGSFFEDGKMINKIQVIPKRKYEPVFSGTINITEDDWRIHSLDLLLTKTSQLEILDTLEIKQIHMPVAGNVWQTKNQVVNFSFNLFGFEAAGTFLDVYDKFETAPRFKKHFFNNVIVQYDTAVNKKSKTYWDSVRPVPLEKEEANDYKVKDSTFKYRMDSAWSRSYIDSLNKLRGKINFINIIYAGFTRRTYNLEHKNYSTFIWHGLLKGLEYNTVEGVSLTASATMQWPIKSWHKEISFTPNVRYGFSNTHLNAWGTFELYHKHSWGNDDGEMQSSGRSRWLLSGGKRLSQFDNENPITPLVNGLYTLFFNHNYMKLYENYFGELMYKKTNDNGLKYSVNLLYEDRVPVENSTSFSIIHYDSSKFTPNYPTELISEQFQRHQALIATATVQYQPGQKYIQYPNFKMSIGSKYPTFALMYQKGFNNILGSDVNFDKWKFSVFDNMNLKLYGDLHYRFDIGGFLNNKAVAVQDYQHFNGNQTIFASEYMNSFQVAPYYANSTTASFYAVGHIEHHFNGFLTNKVPLFKKLNWYLVAGSNAFYVNSNNNYVEVFGGIENIFKLFRVDFVGSYLNGKNGQFGVRFGLGGLLGGKISFKE
jgi:hypothetical protein